MQGYNKMCHNGTMISRDGIEFIYTICHECTK